jgi:hypothetical protein
METLYDVCFAGETLEGQNISAVRAKLAKLFKADETTLDRLFSGKTQLLKRGCDRETALKYKKAIEQAGAKPIIRSNVESVAAQTAEPSPALTAAERIARLAAAADVAETAPARASSDQAEITQASATANERDISLSPPGSDVLRPDERQSDVSADIDVSAIELSEFGARLSKPDNTPLPGPDTGHLSLAEAGEKIPTLRSTAIPVSPDISAIALSPEESDFSDCATPPAPIPAIDLSNLNLAPSGADMLEAGYREAHDAKAPSTDHLELES